MPAFIPSIPLTQPLRHCPALSRSSFTSPPPHIRRARLPRTPTCTSSQPDVPVTSFEPEPEDAESERPVGPNCRLSISGREIAYDYFPGAGPTVVFLPSFFYSRWRQAKANALEIFAKRKGQAILAEEYVGIGRSEGDFLEEGTLSRWIDDTMELIKTVIGGGPVVLVGAGVGGWIMLHVAMRMPKQVAGLVGINPSVDFTEDLLWPSLTAQQKEEIERVGFVDLPWGYRSYPIGKALLEDAKKWLVLRGEAGSLNIQCPVRLLQGLNDEEVPPDRVLQLVDKIRGEDVVAQFIKYGDHVLEEEEDMQRMWAAVSELSDKYFEYDLTSPTSG